MAGRVQWAGVPQNLKQARVQWGGSSQGAKQVYVCVGEKRVCPGDPDYSPVPPDLPAGECWMRPVMALLADFEPPSTVPPAPSLSRESTNPGWVNDGSPRPPDYLTVTANANPTTPFRAKWWVREVRFLADDGSSLGDTKFTDTGETTLRLMWSWPSQYVRAMIRFTNEAGVSGWSTVSNRIWVWGVDPL